MDRLSVQPQKGPVLGPVVLPPTSLVRRASSPLLQLAGPCDGIARTCWRACSHVMSGRIRHPPVTSHRDAPAPSVSAGLLRMDDAIHRGSDGFSSPQKSKKTGPTSTGLRVLVIFFRTKTEPKLGCFGTRRGGEPGHPGNLLATC